MLHRGQLPPIPSYLVLAFVLLGGLGTVAASANDEPPLPAAPGQATGLAADESKDPEAAAVTPPAGDSDPHPLVLLKTSHGDILLKLDRQKAPTSVDNFLGYVDRGFYDGTIFHRVIESFMIQGGGFTRDLAKKETQPPIANEARNGLKNHRGTVAMARTNIVDSATSQFFINVVDNSFLDHTNDTPRGFGYAVFGEVIEGMETVDKIRALRTGARGPFSTDCPLEPVTILSAARAGS